MKKVKEFVLRRHRAFILSLINIFMSGTHLFSLKRVMLNTCVGIKIGRNTKIVGPVCLGNCSTISIGNDCWIGKNFEILGDGKVIVGNNCDFAPCVKFITGSHQLGNSERRAGKGILSTCIIGNGCWIGAEVSIIGENSIGNASVIGAKSLVTKSIGDNVLAVGIPARVIRELDS